MSDDLRTRVLSAIRKELFRQTQVGTAYDFAAGDLTDAVIRELGPIPDRSFVDSDGNRWEWCRECNCEWPCEKADDE